MPKSILSELAFLFTFPSESQKYLLLGQKKEAQTKPTGKGSEGCTGAHVVLKRELGSDTPSAWGWVDSFRCAWPVSYHGGVLFFHEHVDCVSVQEAVRLEKKKRKQSIVLFIVPKLSSSFGVCC